MHLSIAIVGAGPCGLYLAKNLRARLLPGARVDIFERLSRPLGLLRFGVAPDSVSVRRTGELLLKGTKERLFLNVCVGRELSLEELLRYYHVCILSCGAESSRPLSLQGDDLDGVFDSLDFVRSYNGHPDAPVGVKSFLDRLAHQAKRVRVCVIGNGNVSLDVARILLTPAKYLESTEIDKDFLSYLRNINVAGVDIVGRRGLFQSSFTNAELRRITESSHFIPLVQEESLRSSLLHQPEQLDRSHKRKLSLFNRIASNIDAAQSADKTLEFTFFKSVYSVEKGDGSAIGGVILQNNTLDRNLYAKATDNTVRIPSDMLIKCVGFQPNIVSAELLKHVDSKRIFSCGWVATGGKGDLSNTLAATVQLSTLISSMTFDFPVAKDIFELFVGDPRFKNVRVANGG
ncbi:hypothetical protein X943_001731 [Babesia divergens]|uniref:NADPH:adrenodoxin oxidoreductase, mitochondrial n=1 Tax=Babesia divergens TaxID=32595 RepID=A0AAD9GHS5_BABDI|nr:hypothetical protein X943_001731 [Babesia divergens]